MPAHQGSARHRQQNCHTQKDEWFHSTLTRP
jgi:hypothetical protein